MWYTAHVLMAFRFKEGFQKDLIVWENMYLIQARGKKEATVKARELGKKEVCSDPTMRLGDRPVRMVFEGIRKIIECMPGMNSNGSPCDGTELSYSVYRVKDEASLRKLAKGKAVKLICQE